jgi:hypothetical protein
MEDSAMILLIIICIIILLLFLPTIVKVTLIYEDNKLSVYVFNKLLNLSIFNNPPKKEEKTYETKAKPKKGNKNKKFLERLFEECFKKDIFKGRFRPSIKIDCNIEYGFDDAALTGISYGLIYNFSSVLYNLVSKRLKVRKFKFNVVPHYNNPMLKFRITSIFYLNLAQIIYVLIIIFRK